MSKSEYFKKGGGGPYFLAVLLIADYIRSDTHGEVIFICFVIEVPNVSLEIYSGTPECWVVQLYTQKPV